MSARAARQCVQRGEMSNRLAQATVVARLAGQKGRAILTAKNHHVVVDSLLTWAGRMRSSTPLTCYSSAGDARDLVCERAAQENGCALSGRSPGWWARSIRIPGRIRRRCPICRACRWTSAWLGRPRNRTRSSAAIGSRCLMYTTLARAAADRAGPGHRTCHQPNLISASECIPIRRDDLENQVRSASARPAGDGCPGAGPEALSIVSLSTACASAMTPR